ncbi:alkaline phosphatase family protein [Salipaludibacillus aurantiacus]|uniref:alkaline phosphatase family protein n=1 Tax=Salipaludibacillus aurantiacus TaxID=1601833 RepID=UPI000B85B406|nr:alkaline phosphatase family protein [Salipaludibacillus aurantiacus]
MIEVNKTEKRAVMLMLDTLMDKPLQQALKNEHVPAIKYFMEYAIYYPGVVAPFPTMSVNVESTLLTGHYSDRHGVPALVWYKKNENRVINYGTHVFELVKLGLTKSLYDVMYRLNNKHLRKDVKTIHEELQAAGKISASINPLVHRGHTVNEITVPGLIRYFININKTIKTRTSDKFVYGRSSSLSALNKHSYIWNKYGFNNNFSVQEFSYLIKTNNLPHFSLVYFPDHDKNVHKKGPMDLEGIKEMDKQLQTILESFPTWEEALKNNIWILIGDNGQARVGKHKQSALVDIRRLLKPLRITKLRKGVQKDDQIVLANNLRSCFVYTLNNEEVPLTEIAERLKRDDRIDMIAWKSIDWIYVTSGGDGGEFKFKQGNDMKDEYNQSWKIEGEASILDLKIQGKAVTYGDYPDALQRLYSTLHSHAGDFVVTSVKPGHEFITESSPSHPKGASHGGFHKDDSLIPMIVAGTDCSPDFLRIVDLKRWILNLLIPKERGN